MFLYCRVRSAHREACDSKYSYTTLTSRTRTYLKITCIKSHKCTWYLLLFDLLSGSRTASWFPRSGRGGCKDGMHHTHQWPWAIHRHWCVEWARMGYRYSVVPLQAFWGQTAATGEDGLQWMLCFRMQKMHVGFVVFKLWEAEKFQQLKKKSFDTVLSRAS